MGHYNFLPNPRLIIFWEIRSTLIQSVLHISLAINLQKLTVHVKIQKQVNCKLGAFMFLWLEKIGQDTK